MKALLLILLLLIVQSISAQETPEAIDWTTEQRCITAPSQPPEGWTHDGVIFSTGGLGIRAYRSDVATSYYVSFRANEFTYSGRLSPDGRWLAVPTGDVKPFVNLSDLYAVEEIRVYSTAPTNELFTKQFYMYGTAISAIYGVSSVVWLNNERFVAAGALTPPRYFEEAPVSHVLNPFDQSAELLALPQQSKLLSVSLDGMRWIYSRVESNHANGYISAPDQFESSTAIPIALSSNLPKIVSLIQWADDSSRFAAILDNGDEIGVFDRDGKLLTTIQVEDNARFSLSRDGTHLAFETQRGTIQIVNLQARTIIDTCISPEYGFAGGIVFSPNGRQLAYTMPQLGWVYILDTAAWEAYRIDLEAGEVIGWYPLE